MNEPEIVPSPEPSEAVPFNSNRHAGDIVRTYVIYCAGCPVHANAAEDTTPYSRRDIEKMLIRHKWEEVGKHWYCPTCCKREDFAQLTKQVTQRSTQQSQMTAILAGSTTIASLSRDKNGRGMRHRRRTVARKA